MADILHARVGTGIYGYDKRDLVWAGTDKKGMQLAAVRADREHGKFLGYLSFDRFAETGVHQHLGPAFSYFLQGGLADFQGMAREGDMGINLEGATHSAMSYAPTLMASRLEAPVIYPSEDSVKGEVLHTGARPGDIVNHMPEVMPDINIPLESLPWMGTTLAGVQRRMIFDYNQTEHDRRNVQLRLLPYTQIPTFRTSAPVDIFIIGGDLTIGGETHTHGSFFVLDEGALVEMSTEFGALILVWAEGRVSWLNAEANDLFGFNGRC